MARRAAQAWLTVIGVSEPQYDRNTIHGIWLEGISETKDEARSIETPITPPRA